MPLDQALAAGRGLEEVWGVLDWTGGGGVLCVLEFERLVIVLISDLFSSG